MNIDEKIKNNWYLEQDEINTLIKRYRMMKYLNYILAIALAVALLSCSSPTSTQHLQAEIQWLSSSNHNGVYQFKVIESSDIIHDVIEVNTKGFTPAEETTYQATLEHDSTYYYTLVDINN